MSRASYRHDTMRGCKTCPFFPLFQPCLPPHLAGDINHTTQLGRLLRER
jgi:hypothetical protein